MTIERTAIMNLQVGDAFEVYHSPLPRPVGIKISEGAGDCQVFMLSGIAWGTLHVDNGVDVVKIGRVAVFEDKAGICRAY